MLIEKGANVNMANDIGYTPLMVASRIQAPEIVALLLKSGARVPGANFAAQ